MSDTVGQMTIDDKTANQIYKYLVKHDYVDEDDGLSASFQEHKEAATLPTLPTLPRICVRLQTALLNSLIVWSIQSCQKAW